MSRKQIAATVLALSCAFAVPQRAFGSQPEHLKAEFPEPFQVGPFPAGTFCDFTFEAVIFDEIVNVIRFLDDAGAPLSAIMHDAFSVVHTNLDTQVSLEERVHYTAHSDFVTGERTETGNVWHLRRVTDGHHVLTGAGRYVVDLETGEILEATPNSYPELSTICAVLGGAPAQP
jgi:hypothetical protein